MKHPLRPQASVGRFLAETALLVLVNLLLALLLWRQLQPENMEPASPPAAPIVEPLPTTASSAPALEFVTATVAIASPTTPPTTTAAPTAMATATSSEATDTPTVPVPTATQTTTAVVRAPDGLRLRDAPNGREVGRLDDGTVVVLLVGREMAGDLLWQQVLTAGGQEGWVAAAYLEDGP